MSNTVTLESLLARVNELRSAVEFLAARQDELENRLESTDILGALAAHEDLVRKEAHGHYEACPPESVGEDLVGGL